ncbi:MAG: hypothetical protein ACTHMS_22530 [Jatrophihabitans sp.]|uniref:hypothetical protein n=1 Tax=Jatrophihabitans sp. TaxID=1932789 RepID=UPI003F7F593E
MRLRRERPPAAALAVLDAGERVVSWADTDEGTVVLVTPRGVWWPDAGSNRLIGWQHISKAVWQDGALTITEGDVDEGIIRDRAPVSVRLAVPRDLPPAIRKRVQLNVVSTEVATIAPLGSARFVARHLPGRDGVVWWARFEPGTPDTPATRASVRARLAQLDEQWRAAQTP